MDAENGFLIEGKVYEVPTLDSLTLDESTLMYEQCGITQEDFIQEEAETDEEHQARVVKMLRHPGLMASMAEIAYQRGNPTMKPGQVRRVLGKTNRLEMFSTLSAAEEEPDEVPLASTSEPSESSPSGSLANENSTRESSENGGASSTNGSEGQASQVVPIGTTRSDTSSTLAPEISAASGPLI